MSQQKPSRNPVKRKRYCVIKATTLEEILATCNRHIKNINLTHLDYLEEGDGTPTDDFYCDMFRETWADLRDDVQEMLDTPVSSSFQLTLDCYRSGQMSPEQFVQHMQDPLFAAWYEKHK